MTNKVQGISREEFKLDFRYLKWCTPAKKSYKKTKIHGKIETLHTKSEASLPSPRIGREANTLT